jgi:threonine/homoserine/homoserine lactone efflux protein
MTIESSFIFIISLVLLWIKPGPGQAAIITRALNDGFWPAFALAFGAMSGGAVYFVVAVVGVTFINDHGSMIAIVMKLIGATYLFYLGYKGLHDIESGKWGGRTDQLTKKNMIKNFMTGLLIELSNPITVFYFLGLLPTLMPIQDITNIQIIIGVSLIIYPGLLFYSVVIGLSVQIKETLSSTRLVKNINLVTSVGFILIGMYLLFSAISNADPAYNLL